VENERQDKGKKVTAKGTLQKGLVSVTINVTAAQ